MYKFLEHIDDPSQIRGLKAPELKELAEELRAFIIDIVSAKEGHLGASLGVVELTLALHYVFNTPDDLLVWDVGHQAYGHKILTGRRSRFSTNRQFNGLSGFPKREESEYDPFGTGHSSTSVSAVLGMAIASKLKGYTNRNHIAVIGDASIASGMAFEGLNHAGVSDANILIVLNDNTMGIDPSVGALKEYFANVKAGRRVRKNNIIEALNFSYHGPVDGHDINALIEALTELRAIPGPKFLHVITTKGKGLQKAEQDQVRYHAPGKFDKETGMLLKKKDGLPDKFQDVFGKTLLELAKNNENIVGITPAMPTGSSLKLMIDEMPDRAFDVGIAEQHAVTLAAGMASQGLIPYCTIYSTFLQRAYDQIIHDVALQNLPVVFCVDRAGLVGEDGPTHHGSFDLAYLRCIPNMIIAAPMDECVLRNLMFTVQNQPLESPIAIRYPRGRGTMLDWKKEFENVELGRGRVLKKGSRFAVLTIGTIGKHVESVLNSIDTSEFAHVDMQFLKPLDTNLLKNIFSTYDAIVTIEDGTIFGGLGSAVSEFASKHGYSQAITTLGIPDKFVPHGSMSDLYKSIGLDRDTLLARFNDMSGHNK